MGRVLSRAIAAVAALGFAAGIAAAAKSARSCRQLQNIRLSADAANPLSRSRNWRADGDGCVDLHLMQVSRRGLRALRFARLEASRGEDR